MTTCILEYFDHGDTEEVLQTLDENGVGPTNLHKFRAIVAAIEVAMDHKPSHR